MRKADRNEQALYREKPLLTTTSTHRSVALEDVMGSANYRGPALSQAEIDAALAADVVRRHSKRQ